MSQYPFYIIKSNKAIEDIYETIMSEYESYDGDVDTKTDGNQEIDTKNALNKIALVKSIWAKGKETDLTLCVFDERIYQKLKEKGEVNIELYKVREYNAPREGETKNLYIQLPAILSLSQCQNYVNKRMRYLIEYGLWESSDFMVTYPNKSRSTNEHGGKAFIVFKNLHEEIEKIALTRMFFSGVQWDNSDFRVNCYWARKPKTKVRNGDFPDLGSQSSSGPSGTYGGRNNGSDGNRDGGRDGNRGGNRDGNRNRGRNNGREMNRGYDGGSNNYRIKKRYNDEGNNKINLPTTSQWNKPPRFTKLSKAPRFDDEETD